MKLRIKGNSMRLRVSRSEVTRLLAGDRLEETIRFGPETRARFTYGNTTGVVGEYADGGIRREWS
jgi:hypothetical protein